MTRPFKKTKIQDRFFLSDNKLPRYVHDPFSYLQPNPKAPISISNTIKLYYENKT